MQVLILENIMETHFAFVVQMKILFSVTVEMFVIFQIIKSMIANTNVSFKGNKSKKFFKYYF